MVEKKKVEKQVAEPKLDQKDLGQLIVNFGVELQNITHDLTEVKELLVETSKAIVEINKKLVDFEGKYDKRSKAGRF